MPRARNSVNCWPEGSAGNQCPNTIPNTKLDTMERYGWGMVFAPDYGSSSGMGHFYACPLHRDDIGENKRQDAIQLYCAATGKKEDDL